MCEELTNTLEERNKEINSKNERIIKADASVSSLTLENADLKKMCEELTNTLEDRNKELNAKNEYIIKTGTDPFSLY